MVAGLPGLFVLVLPDADLTITEISHDFLRAFSVERARVVGRPLREVVADAPHDAIRRSVESGERVSARSLDPRAGRAAESAEKNGRTFVVSPVRDEAGAVERVVVRIDDIDRAPGDERVGAEDAFRATEILESITEGFFTLDREWRFDYVNREALRILDRPTNDLTGRTLWEVYPGLENTDFDRAYRLAMVEGKTSSFTAYYPMHRRWYEVTTYPASRGISVYFRDATARKTLENDRARLAAESETQRMMYQAALSNTPDLVYIFDLDHRFVYANEALLAMWGLGLEEALARDWKGLGYEDWHAQMHDREIDEVIATGKSVRGEVHFEGTGGRRLYDYIFAPITGVDGSVVAVAGTTRDITDRQRNEQAIRDQAERLVEADRAKDLFIATLSHELRNPLAPLRSGLELLRARGGDAATTRVHETMERQLGHLVRLVDDLLETSRVTQGTISLKKAATDLSTVVRTAVEATGTAIEAASHRLEIDLPAEPLVLDGDPTRLAQILSNLLHNAARYTPSGGRIVVSGARRDDFAEIRVTDDGAGISAEAIGHVFEMFNRGELAAGHAESGLGIGLALSRRLAELHGGTLEARSEGRDKGTELTLRIPLVSRAAPASEAPRPVKNQPLGHARVLVVDDNQDAADLLAMLLEAAGAEVWVANDGDRALDLATEHRPTVAFLDIGMPGMNGYEVAREMRTRFDAPPVLLVALTGWGQEEDRRKAREAGFDHHLVKPVDIEAVRSILATHAAE